MSKSGPIAGSAPRVSQPASKAAEVELSGEHGGESAELHAPPSPEAWHREVARCWVVREFNGSSEQAGVPQMEDVEWDWIWDEAGERWVEPCTSAEAPTTASTSASPRTRRAEKSRLFQEIRQSLYVLALLIAWYVGSIALVLAISAV